MYSTTSAAALDTAASSCSPSSPVLARGLQVVVDAGVTARSDAGADRHQFLFFHAQFLLDGRHRLSSSLAVIAVDMRVQGRCGSGVRPRVSIPNGM
jgi:hypothetical protein